jgi:threonine dehydratase
MSEGLSIPTVEDVRAAAERIASFVHRTPVLTSRTLDRELGAQIFFKAENLQKVGAFKARGATNTVLSLDDAAARRGVATHSSGNHAAALAFAASIRGIPCTVVMPDTAPEIKVTAVRGYGAGVVFCPQSEREATCDRVVAETGATLVHPYDDPRVIAGQGTAALELLEDVPDLDYLIAPVGGGGLMSGTAIVGRALRPSLRLIGAEPAAVDDAFRSLVTGIRQPRIPEPATVADGLLTALSERTFAVLSGLGVSIVTVSEADIIAAARFHLQRMKTVVEPSGAVGLAAVRTIGLGLEGRRVGVIISGGNTDFAWLERP